MELVIPARIAPAVDQRVRDLAVEMIAPIAERLLPLSFCILILNKARAELRIRDALRSSLSHRPSDCMTANLQHQSDR